LPGIAALARSCAFDDQAGRADADFDFLAIPAQIGRPYRSMVCRPRRTALMIALSP
jgi:hypothetical protein